MEINKQLAQELSVELWQVDAAVKLIDEGNTIPFISRYRKEMTGSLNDEVLRNRYTYRTYLRNLEDKKQQVLSSIEEQGKLTPELKTQILEAKTLVVVEDLYRPYRPKRRTRATIAKEKGLEPLANLILLQMTRKPLEEEAREFLSEEKEVLTVEDAISGAKDILAETISDEADYRIRIREMTAKEGKLVSTAKDEKAQSVYEMYYTYEEPISKVAGHRTLAINRGEKEKFLTVKIEAPEERILGYLEKKVIVRENPCTTPVLKEIIDDSYHRLIAPAIEREIRNSMTEKAEEGAIAVFGKNPGAASPSAAHLRAGGLRVGSGIPYRMQARCGRPHRKGAGYGGDLSYSSHYGEEDPAAKDKLAQWDPPVSHYADLSWKRNGIQRVEQIIVELLGEIKEHVQYVIVNEAGASVYSASKLATEEFPNFDVGQRSAVSIARRIQDPLAELVKIDPKSIGVGQYQHDCNQKKLGEALNGVVEDSVNKVGVDLNTASASLLEYISGISKAVAKNIVAYREENGRFTDRRQLLKVPKLGPKAYEQCAGFLRIQGGDNPLDSTSVHPESYEAAAGLLEKLGYQPQNFLEGSKGCQRR